MTPIDFRLFIMPLNYQMKSGRIWEKDLLEEWSRATNFMLWVVSLEAHEIKTIMIHRKGQRYVVSWGKTAPKEFSMIPRWQPKIKRKIFVGT